MIDFVIAVWAISGVAASVVVARSIRSKYSAEKQDCDTCACLTEKSGSGRYDCKHRSYYFRLKPKYCGQYKPRKAMHEKQNENGGKQ